MKPQLIRIREVIERTGLSKPQVYKLMKKEPPAFPLSLHLGTSSTVGWVESEIDEWVKQRIEERDEATGASMGASAS